MIHKKKIIAILVFGFIMFLLANILYVSHEFIHRPDTRVSSEGTIGWIGFAYSIIWIVVGGFGIYLLNIIFESIKD